MQQKQLQQNKMLQLNLLQKILPTHDPSSIRAGSVPFNINELANVPTN